MKKLALALAFVASSAFAAIDGTPHDLMTLTGNTAAGACQYCHMPHHSNVAATVAPIWAREMRTNYTIKSPASTVSGTTISSPSELSRACLSCHDGTTSVALLHNGQNLANSYMVNNGTAGGTNLGLALNNDHPVSLSYVAGRAGLDTIANVTGVGEFVLFGSNSDQLECSSCHDPHVQPASKGNFLRNATAADFCVACHVSK